MDGQAEHKCQMCDDPGVMVATADIPTGKPGEGLAAEFWFCRRHGRQIFGDMAALLSIDD